MAPILSSTHASATMFGIKLNRLRADLADFRGANPPVQVDGEVHASIGDFMRFIAESPVDDWIDHATERRGPPAMDRSRSTSCSSSASHGTIASPANSPSTNAASSSVADSTREPDSRQTRFTGTRYVRPM